MGSGSVLSQGLKEDFSLDIVDNQMLGIATGKQNVAVGGMEGNCPQAGARIQ